MQRSAVQITSSAAPGLGICCDQHLLIPPVPRDGLVSATWSGNLSSAHGAFERLSSEGCGCRDPAQGTTKCWALKGTWEPPFGNARWTDAGRSGCNVLFPLTPWVRGQAMDGQEPGDASPARARSQQLLTHSAKSWRGRGENA